MKKSGDKATRYWETQKYLVTDDVVQQTQLPSLILRFSFMQTKEVLKCYASALRVKLSTGRVHSSSVFEKQFVTKC